MTSHRRFAKFLTIVLCFAGAAGLRAAETPAAKPVAIDIAVQPLRDALAELGKQTGLQVVMYSGIGKQSTSARLTGKFTPDAALGRLLAATGLRYEYLDARTVAIFDGSQPPPSTSTSPEERMRLVQSFAAPPEAAHVASAERQDSQDEKELVVTGSRLRNADRTAPIITIDRTTIERRGFSTAEDIIRSLPQNLATMNAARSVTQPVGGDGLPVGPAAQGEATANLRGIGQSATLVLIDGRRTAGSAAFSGSAVNLASIPVASIERIEVLADSAAAVYGSDAIAGVINIVLRKDFRGASSSMRFEDGDNGGDKRAFDQVIGLGWGSGNITATLSASETQPISSAQGGYITNDLRYLGGYDARNTLFAQAGNVLGRGSLPPGYDGTEAWTAANLTQANFQLARGDLVPRDQSSETRNQALYVNLQQSLGDGIEGFASVRYSQDKTNAVGIAPFIYAAVTPTNPYNRLGTALTVGYYAGYEASAGLIPLGYSTNKLENLGFDTGARFDLPVSDWRADVSAVHSVASSRSGGEGYSSAFQFFDPVVGSSVNVFGDGTAQNLAPFLAAFGPRTSITDRETTLYGLTASAEGTVAQLSAGNLRAAFGGEYRVEGLSFGANDYIAAQSLSDFSPEQTIMALFAETHVPLVSSLSATLQARWEQYETDSSDPVSDGKTFEKMSPRVGLVWNATGEFVVRGSWGKSFKAPNLTNLVVVESLGTFPSAIYDPIEDETVPVFFDDVGNPNLKPETGETVTFGFDWSPSLMPGFDMSVSYNRTAFDDQIVGTFFVLGGVSIEDVIANPEAFPGVTVRDPNTNTLLRLRSFPFNVSSVKVEAVDFDLKFASDHAWGALITRLLGTYTLKHDSQAAAILAPLALEGTTDADKLSAVFSLGWSKDRYGADLYGNYTNAYWNTEIAELSSNPTGLPMHVPSRTTWDLTGYYNFGVGWKVSGGVRNLFDEKFPFHQGFAGPFDTRRVDLRGRMAQIELRKDFRF